MYKNLIFKEIDFHDCRVYAFGLSPDSYKLLIDVDWIVSRKLCNENFIFYISPSTFVFSNVWDIDIDITMNSYLTIDSIEIISTNEPRNVRVLCKNATEYTLRINFLEGSITFRTIDFTIFQRKNELEATISNLNENERDGISLSMTGKIKKVRLASI